MGLASSERGATMSKRLDPSDRQPMTLPSYPYDIRKEYAKNESKIVIDREKMDWPALIGVLTFVITVITLALILL